MEENQPGKTEVDEGADISDVRRNWRQYEDFGIAYAMQQSEFSNHFDLNRTERRIMQTDTHVSRVEQRMEDQYAQEYYEQLRLDHEKQDELLARQLQEKLDLDEQQHRRGELAKIQCADEEFAKRLQEKEAQQQQMQPELHRMDLNFPPEVPQHLVSLVQKAHKDNIPLKLPDSSSLEDLNLLYNVLKYTDPRLAEEVRSHQMTLQFSSGKNANQFSQATSSSMSSSRSYRNNASSASRISSTASPTSSSTGSANVNSAFEVAKESPPTNKNNRSESQDVRLSAMSKISPIRLPTEPLDCYHLVPGRDSPGYRIGMIPNQGLRQQNPHANTDEVRQRPASTSNAGASHGTGRTPNNVAYSTASGMSVIPRKAL